MNDLNILTIQGRLTKDPKQISKSGGESLAVSMTVASNDSNKDSGEWKESPLFVDVTVFGKLAERCMKYLGKGNRVTVVGRAGLRKWESDKGFGANIVIRSNEVHFIDFKKEHDTPTPDGDCPF